MKFKKFLLISFLLITTSAQALTIKIASLAPDGSSWINTMKQATDNISKQTHNRVNFKFYTGGVMGSDASVLRKMHVGQLQGGAFAIGSLKKFSNIVQLYSMGFTFENIDELMAIRKKYDPIIKNEVKKHGYEILGISSGGFAYIMSANPIASIADIQKQKFWLPDDDYISQKIFQIADINPVLLPISDVYTGLQTGLINALAVNPTSAILLQWYSKLNYLVDLPLTMLTGVFVIDNKTMNRLSSADREVVRKELGKAFDIIDRQNIKEEEKALAALKNGGLKFIKLDDKIVKEFKDFADKSLKELKGNYPKQEYQKMLKDLKNIRGK